MAGRVAGHSRGSARGKDASGLVLSADKWIIDDEVKKIRAETKYRNGNCALIK